MLPIQIQSAPALAAGPIPARRIPFLHGQKEKIAPTPSLFCNRFLFASPRRIALRRRRHRFLNIKYIFNKNLSSLDALMTREGARHPRSSSSHSSALKSAQQMGVPKFFRWISERYPLINETINFEHAGPVFGAFRFQHATSDPPSPSPSPSPPPVKRRVFFSHFFVSSVATGEFSLREMRETLLESHRPRP